jgi:peptide-methionine (S)-S-oxide reductase
LHTSVGYAGGSKLDPTYRDLGDHTESIQIEYDANEISFEALVDMFWNMHNPARKPYSRQYTSILFYHDEDQKRVALNTKERVESKLKSYVHTEIVPYTKYYLAEEYHQKYYLQQYLKRNSELHEEIRRAFSDFDEFIYSTVAARMNGYVAGHGTKYALEKEFKEAGLPSEFFNTFVDSTTLLKK